MSTDEERREAGMRTRREVLGDAHVDRAVAAVTADAENVGSRHDMGGDIAPYFVERGTAGVYDFLRNDVPGSTPRDRDYWRDVGTLDSFYDAHMDLISVDPEFSLANPEWPIFTDPQTFPPARTVHGSHGRVGTAMECLLAPGSVVSGSTVSW